MNAHALEALEFERIRALLAARTASPAGRERAVRCAPLANLEGLRELIETVAEAVTLRMESPEWGDVAFPDAREAVAHAVVEGSVLEAPALTSIAQVLETAARCARSLASSGARERRPRLAAISARLAGERDFPQRIHRTFEPSGEVRDDATPALRALRRELQETRLGAAAKLETLSQRFRASGEDSFVTLRAGRYVLSIAAGEKRRLAGIVHGRSATGKTLYVEPLDLVDVNNSLAELEADERAEIHRLLRDLTKWVRDHAPILHETLLALAEIDEIDARARLALDLRAIAPLIDEGAKTLRIVQGRHPLLYLALQQRAVPLDLMLEGEQRGLVVSGPNMGGKTVLLKTVGIIVLMALSGLFIPAADGTVLPWSDEIFVDIGDEQSLESDLSTYAARLRHMRAALDLAGPRSIVLLDELGTGTDPAEGAALGQALLAQIARQHAFCVATTHLGAFKAFAAATNGFANAAMEYDSETLRPTYRLLTGVPGRSHAFELARREGWPAHALAEAGEFLPAESARADTLLQRIEEELRTLRQEREEVAAQRSRLTEDREAYRRLSQSLKEKTAAVRLEKALEEDRRLREARDLLADLRAQVARLAEAHAAATAAEEGRRITSERRKLHELERQLSEFERTRPVVPRANAVVAGGPLAAEEIAPGRRAFARSLGVEVTIAPGDAGARRVWVVHKGVRVALPVDDLRHPPEAAVEEAAAKKPAASGYIDLQEQLIDKLSPEIDLRGLTREECLEKLDLYLDRAVLAGHTSVRIIHGKGTGVLHREVQAFLKKHRHVSAYRTGEPNEGGWGVTIATLVTARPASSSENHTDARQAAEGND